MRKRKSQEEESNPISDGLVESGHLSELSIVDRVNAELHRLSIRFYRTKEK